MTACYTDRLSARPGQSVKLHASSPHGPCRLEVSRIGRTQETVSTIEGIAVADTPTPADADRSGCDWPVVFELAIGDDWRSGYYDLKLIDSAGKAAHHFICVRPKSGARGAKALLVLATNTLHAYNYWGGASAYADVTALMSGKKTLPQAMADAIGVMSTRRPFSQFLLAPPADIPRLVNMRPRGFGEKPWAGDAEWLRALKVPFSPYDASAGFLHKWEHAFVDWAESEGIALDYATDFDLETDSGALDGYRAVLFVGHSEYWSAPQRDAVETFVDAGGKLCILSGNTAFWKVRFEDEGATFVCHKTRGLERDPTGQADPSLGTHMWSYHRFARPEASIIGLTFLFGGYHRLGMCAARGQGGYTVYDHNHWALADTDLFYGDLIAPELPLLGYENDGCRFTFGADGVPRALPLLGVPENLEIIAIAPCSFGEGPTPYRPLIPPEDLHVVARDVFQDPAYASNPGIIRGHAVMASFRRGKGEVFNCGTTEWAHALRARDPFVTQITRNVLARFGAL